MVSCDVTALFSDKLLCTWLLNLVKFLWYIREMGVYANKGRSCVLEVPFLLVRPDFWSN